MSNDAESPANARVGFRPLLVQVREEESYGSTSPTDEDDEEDGSFISGGFGSDAGSEPRGGRRSQLAMMKSANVWTSVRHVAAEYDLDLVPTKVTSNVKLVTDPNMDSKQKGTLYFCEDAFYNNANEPRYALTVHPDIYQRILDEVNDAGSVPCGLYFCCHGGDGAHTGVSHDDHVDITVAWLVVSVVFGVMMFLELALPSPTSNFDDDFFE